MWQARGTARHRRSSLGSPARRRGGSAGPRVTRPRATPSATRPRELPKGASHAGPEGTVDARDRLADKEGVIHSSPHLWVAILAGGDGRRLQSVTRDASGRHVPKQFWRLGADESLLQHALGRATRLVPRNRILVVVQEAHRGWWRPALSRVVPDDNIIVQHANQGTAVAVLHAVQRVLARDRDPWMLVLPSDHGIEDEHAWNRTLMRATDLALETPDQLVLVGVESPIGPDFGWIVPGREAADGSRSVLAFVEKPSGIEAASLAGQGAMCSTFAFVSSAGALLRLFARHASDLLARFVWAVEGPRASGVLRLEDEAALPAVDFSRDLLQRAPEDVRLLPSLPCGWTDLGTPARLERWLERRASVTAKSTVRERESVLTS